MYAIAQSYYEMRRIFTNFFSVDAKDILQSVQAKTPPKVVSQLQRRYDDYTSFSLS